MLLSTTLEQSSEFKILLNQIMSNIDNYFLLNELLDKKLIYLNGENTYISKVEDGGTFNYLDFKGCNKYKLIKNVRNVKLAYEMTNNSNDNLKICNELLIKLEKEFVQEYGVYNGDEYNNSILIHFTYSPLFSSFRDGTYNLIYSPSFNIFKIRYFINGETKYELIPCDSLFKLRYWINNEQNDLINNYKKICQYRNIIPNIFNNNQIIPKNIFQLINQLDKEYNTIFQLKLEDPSIDKVELEKKIKIYSTKRFNLDHIIKKNNQLWNDKDYALISNRIIADKLLKIFKNQHINIELQWEMKKKYLV